LDAEKEIYHRCYDAVVPGMVRGGILVADDAINHQATLKAHAGSSTTSSKS